jgi:hypothetical protein
MSKNPQIVLEDDYGTVIGHRTGRFIKDKKTVFLPFCPETGTITASADGKPLPRLKVKALGDARMELLNTQDFVPDRLNSVDFFINDQALQEGSTRNKVMSCSARIKSVFYGGSGTANIQICSFARSKGKKRR